jgi:hypothetical protein
MRLLRTRRRVRVVRDAVAMLATIYRRDRNLLQLLGKAWSVTTREGFGGVRSRVILLAHPEPHPVEVPPPLSYTQWIERFDSLGDADLQAAERHLATLQLPDLLILLVVTRDTVASLPRALASWQTSIHAGWHAALVLSADLSGAEIARLEASVSADPRVSVLRTPDEVEAIRSRCGYALLCYGAVLLNPLSAYMFLEAAIRTDAEIVYSDNDRIVPVGRRTDPAF